MKTMSLNQRIKKVIESLYFIEDIDEERNTFKIQIADGAIKVTNQRTGRSMFLHSTDTNRDIANHLRFIS